MRASGGPGARLEFGRVGGDLTDVAGGSPTFKDSPTGLLKRIEIDTTGTVTFNAPSSDTAQSYGIGAQTLHFSQDGTVLLTSKASNSSAPDLTMYAGGPMFHAVNVTTAARGAGTLMFKEALTMSWIRDLNAVYLRSQSL